MSDQLEPEMDNKSIFEYSQQEYQDLYDRFETQMYFKDHTIEEWLVAIKIKAIQENATLQDLENYTIKISTITDIILENFSLAKAHHSGLKSSVERAMYISKAQILSDIDSKNSTESNPAKRARKPTADVLETLAYNRNISLHQSLAISEMFVSFWETQYKKIYLLNQRVTSLNILKNIENKNSI